MGGCCEKDSGAEQPRRNQQNQVNPFKHARNQRIVQDEDGKLTKVSYKPPSDPEAAKLSQAGEAHSLVTHSLLNAPPQSNVTVAQ